MDKKLKREDDEGKMHAAANAIYDLLAEVKHLRAENESLKAELSAMRAAGNDPRSVDGPGGGGPSDWSRRGGGSGDNSKTQSIEIPGPGGGGGSEYPPRGGGGGAGMGYIPRGGAVISSYPRGHPGGAGISLGPLGLSLEKTPDEVNPLLALAKFGREVLYMLELNDYSDMDGETIKRDATKLGLLDEHDALTDKAKVLDAGAG